MKPLLTDLRYAAGTAVLATFGLAGCASSSSTSAPATVATAAPPPSGVTPASPAPAAQPPAATAATVSAPATSVPPRVKGQNPFDGIRLYVNPYGQAASAAQEWQSSHPSDAKFLQKIAQQPTGWWMGEWSGDIEPAVHNLGNATNSLGMVPVVVVYNVPNRDCGQYSKGGSTSSDTYKRWIRDFAKGAGSFRFIAVLEPDALGQLTKCLKPADQKARLAMIHDAVDVLEATPGVSVYVDGGNAKWLPAPEMAKRLKAAGVEDADGFALNVSNYVATDESIAYGHAISSALGGKHFVIDTGRNGNGATEDAEWCNPKGRALGPAPTSHTGDPLVDAFFWFKPPGESDGECNGGPKAGDFWPQAAIDLAKAAKW
ncbi:MAG TPA: glycoside hydrolase family 6 protein [Polyangiaceae bacterium]|nr:glycoside hydrolase family 6 protein [Polyangiaceae bacterium]